MQFQIYKIPSFLISLSIILCIRRGKKLTQTKRALEREKQAKFIVFLISMHSSRPDKLFRAILWDFFYYVNTGGMYAHLYNLWDKKKSHFNATL